MSTPENLPAAAVNAPRPRPAGRGTPLRKRLAGWFTTPVLIFATVMLLVGAVGLDLFGPAPAIVVSPRTTWITSPLAKDGLPDYVKHLLDVHGPAPAPGENAAVPLLAALWPMGMAEADALVVCEAIGVEPAPVAMSLGHTTRDFASEADEAASAPWRGEDVPLLRDWLDVHREAIDLVVEATDRPRLWLPSPGLLRGEPWVLVHTPPPTNVTTLGVAGRVLALRAMQFAGEGRFEEAWRFTLAIHRLARLVAPPRGRATCIADLFAARYLAIVAHDCTLALIASDTLPEATLAAIRSDLAALPDLPSLRSCLAVERLVALDSLVGLTREQGRSMPLTEVLSSRGPHLFFVRSSLDWNVVLAMLNDIHDRVDEAAGRASHADRVAALRAVTGSVMSAWHGPYVPSALDDVRAIAALVLVGRRARTHAVGEMICADVLGLYDLLEGIVVESPSLVDLALVAAALEAARRADPGHAYPQRLEDLVPALLASVPLDRFTDKPLAYERRGDGYLLYSVGRNLADDLGTAGYHGRAAGWIVRGEWQEGKQDYHEGDLVIRMPMPARKVPQP